MRIRNYLRVGGATAVALAMAFLATGDVHSQLGKGKAGGKAAGHKAAAAAAPFGSVCPSVRYSTTGATAPRRGSRRMCASRRGIRADLWPTLAGAWSA